MGWSSGSLMMSEMIEAMEELVPNYSARVELYKRFVEIFEEQDCDTLEECIDESTAFEEAYKSVHEIFETEMQNYDDDND